MIILNFKFLFIKDFKKNYLDLMLMNLYISLLIKNLNKNNLFFYKLSQKLPFEIIFLIKAFISFYANH
jgi:hypothetical protein